jgi:hypothetical protein
MQIVGKATVDMTPEQEEILDSGLRMLAHMIAETHLHRIALRKKNEAVSPAPEIEVDDNSAGGHDE